jgi:hypothetical protein
MKMDSRTLQQVAEAGFKAGWKAASLTLADLMEQGGHIEQAGLLRKFSDQPAPCEAVEVQPGESKDQALARTQRGGTPS